MTTKTNSLEGGSSGTGITSGNSGGGSGDAFDAALNAEFSNVRAAHGSLSARCVLSAASTANVEWATAGTHWFARSYLYMDTAPPANMQIINVLSTGTLRAMVQVQSSDRKVRILDAGFTQIGISTNALAVDAWHRIEVEFTQGTTTAGLVVVKIYSGANLESGTPTETITSSSATVSAWNQIRIGCMFSANQTWSDGYHDSVGISDTAALGPFTPPSTTKAPAVPRLRPKLRALLVR